MHHLNRRAFLSATAAFAACPVAAQPATWQAVAAQAAALDQCHALIIQRRYAGPVRKVQGASH